MNTLIKIREQVLDQETVQTVNARDLHTFLEIKRDFSN
ncbi:phage anti-repressor protein [Bartonella heixiaziensis]